MATLRKHPRSPFYYACITLQDGTRTNLSTGVPYAGSGGLDFAKLEKTFGQLLDAEVKITPKTGGLEAVNGAARRGLAQRIANEFEDAIAEAKNGRLIDARARKSIAKIHAIGNPDRRLSSSSAADFLDAWLKRKEMEASSNTHEKYESVVTRFKAFLGAKAAQDISSVSAADIVKFRDELAGQVAVGTVNVSLKILRSAFAQARRDGLVDVNEAERVTTLKRREERFERRPFTLEELKRILAAADEEWRGMILFGLYTGQRLGDIASLTWQNVDLQQQEVRLLTEKTGRRQIVPIAQPLSRYLESLPAGDKPDAPLFPKANGIVERLGRASQLSNQFYDLLVDAGMAKKKSHQAPKEGAKGRSAKRELNPLSFHSLRHTATSLLKAAGVSEAIAMEFVGHESNSVSRHYTHIPTEALRRAASKLPDVTA